MDYIYTVYKFEDIFQSYSNSNQYATWSESITQSQGMEKNGNGKNHYIFPEMLEEKKK